MENRYSDFYQGKTEEKLKNVMDCIVYSLREYGTIKITNTVGECLDISAKLTWDGLKSFHQNGLISTLEDLVKKLVSFEPFVEQIHNEKIKMVIEPLEIIITELKLTCEN